jgi:7,8-dihydropterin-6-yl-methyl-4-(beta-D-ribofuranosyl)aminobenzene 5'-phosphate synthase
VKENKIPVVVHPAAFRERWRAKDPDTMVGPSLPPPGDLWEDLGATVVRSASPYQLASGCWTTGTIPRRSFETAVTEQNRFYREGDAFLPDCIEDDQALIIHLEGKGLVIVAGCAHAGIVNTLNYARELTGIERVCAILGGFHLSGAREEMIQQTIDHLTAARPEMVIPCHCTGFHAMSRIASQMPNKFVEGLVGATFSW